MSQGVRRPAIGDSDWSGRQAFLSQGGPPRHVRCVSPAVSSHRARSRPILSAAAGAKGFADRYAIEVPEHPLTL
jgi:hypothetical protein